MKKLVFLSALLLLLVTACQSVEITSTRSEPIRNTPMNVFEDVIKVQDLGALEVTVASGNLFSNGGFENNLDSWGACDTGKISITDKAYEGTSALSLEAGNCFYQSAEVSATQEFNLSCFVNPLSGEGWTGMGLTFSDNTWNSLSEATPAIITSSGYNQYNVSGTAPANAKHVSMWLYSDNPTVVDNCSLMLNEPSPPPPPVAGGNLLENGDFEISTTSGGDFHWAFGCDEFLLWSDIEDDVYAGNFAIGIQDGLCMDQSLSASDIEALKGQDFTYSCYVKNPRSYGSISIFFDDQPIFQEVPNSSEYQLVEINGTAPANATNGFVSTYADDLMFIDNCSLTFQSDVPNPNPEFTFPNSTEVAGELGFDIEGNTRVYLKNLTWADPTAPVNTGNIIVQNYINNSWVTEAEIAPPTDVVFPLIYSKPDVILENNTIYVTGKNSASEHSIYVYGQDASGEWVVQQVIGMDSRVVPTRSYETFIKENFATSVKVMGDLMIVQTRVDVVRGRNIYVQETEADIYTLVDGSWIFKQNLPKLYATNLITEVVVTPERIVYSTYPYPSANRGEIAVLDLTSDGHWELTQTIAPPTELSVGYTFGTSLALIGNHIVATSESNDFLYSLNTSTNTWEFAGDFSDVLNIDFENTLYSVIGYTENKLLVNNGSTQNSFIYVLDTSSELPTSWTVITKLVADLTVTENIIQTIRFVPYSDTGFLRSNLVNLVIGETEYYGNNNGSSNRFKEVLTFNIP